MLAIAVGLLVDARVGDAVELVVDLRARLAEGLPGAGGVDGVGSLPAELVGDAPGEVRSWIWVSCSSVSGRVVTVVSPTTSSSSSIVSRARSASNSTTTALALAVLQVRQ